MISAVVAIRDHIAAIHGSTLTEGHLINAGIDCNGILDMQDIECLSDPISIKVKPVERPGASPQVRPQSLSPLVL